MQALETEESAEPRGPISLLDEGETALLAVEWRQEDGEKAAFMHPETGAVLTLVFARVCSAHLMDISVAPLRVARMCRKGSTGRRSWSPHSLRRRM